ncbi:MAG TPA: secretin N-terminal domain-containing protein [Blastocatellia bacterium]|nr:secretin N-terminal domain-containing protein [Blastocatellia bacterium]
MAQSIGRIRQAVALALMLIMIAPVAAMASDGKKHFKQGLKYEDNQQWDKAAEQFALAVAEKPSNVEYQLHLQRALVSAGIMLVKRGDGLAEQKDYNSAYQAYRQAYAYDPTNELALIKARRMLEAQGLPTDNLPTGGDPAGPKSKPDSDPNTKASYNPGAKGARNVLTQLPTIPGRRFAKTDVIYRDTPLLTAIEQLAQTMKLNVIFDQQVTNMMRASRLNLELRDVTYPRALEMVLKTNNLMYAQLDTRTVVIASDNPQSRMKFEPYSVRTFYIKNADLQDIRAAIQATLQTKSITPVKQLNALIVRDTPANLELIDAMIDSLDKSKAEVLVDVNIYEVSRNDLMQIGNQFAVPDPNSQGGLNLGFIGGLGQNSNIDRGGRAHTIIGSLAGATPLGFALGLPTSAISFFQDKGKAKLLASTQVHVIDGESNTVRIGQRVPIQTASLPTFGNVTDNTRNRGNNTNGLNSGDISLGVNGALGFGIPQIQYENVGLNIDVKPTVFEDEVQMTLKIESTSVDQSTGKLTPSFNQRTMNSVARVKDGQNTLVAGVSQNVESKTIKGLPIIGLIPILGRFFATPDTTNRQSDVVITVTPHILRRADIREEDHLAKAAGDGTGPNNQLKIEQILYIAEQQEAEQNPVASGGAVNPPAEKPVAQVNNTQQPTIGPIPNTNSPGVVVQPVPTTAAPAVKPNIQRMTVDKPGAPTEKNEQQNNQQANQQRSNRLDDDDDDDDDEPAAVNQQLMPIAVSAKAATPVATKGQDLYVAIIINGSNDISSAHIALSYDPNIIEVKSVRDSGLMRTGGSSADLQFTGENGVLNVQMDKPQGSGGSPSRGQLCLIVFTVKNAGQSPLTINESQTYFRTPNGQALPLRVQSSQIEVR